MTSTDSSQATSDRYVVIGNPVAHSRSPAIHAAFARQTGEAVQYDRLEAPLDGFADAVRQFFAEGGYGCNVTVPFKLEAYDLADRLTERAEAAGAVNTLWIEEGLIHGDNTDGIGLVRDIQDNLDTLIEGKRVLLLGAGGAAMGAMLPLIECRPSRIVVANRTASRASDMLEEFVEAADQYGVELWGGGLDALDGLSEDEAVDVVINASSSSLHGEVPPVPEFLLGEGVLAYDMMYGAEPTVFLQFAARCGARTSDGLGMLVEQAAEAFYIWRGVRPRTAPVLAELRAALQAERKG
ncbi:shikimate dehydrogenase [Cupriavidus necator]|uniref:Shikimate dehydrogenase (NADP(+)) n=2 Tax=Cupriavidus necator (strain ATCC 17699 / DSM 428 / KCTC 22496 / NCIMB 10442 / H16 / Stanier 337) TaxID=381666 RepID=AROE_CUPNH|nr:MULTISPECIES: shikimate dehydrogenase [Cupriavidus]Q0K6Y5.1 RecName: Full=Shikimate dehydrogenase (NADP(+)); Short=SDH [Cupriavidus necator H16]EON17646.1 shikimate 5-dehydrogenase [Cupriavidus sp. GA3-3]KUE84842.1 shikimate dehydrogenase [Cupriavidus necator]QCC01996.1 shikimate dehydrogenase [Cupriavidus necator H16]QQB75171.1 shikimate dehydrogenase [Cupriavidus necator]WKA40399.1 shikimate dehydrogenase [Cupriavidus necator]